MDLSVHLGAIPAEQAARTLEWQKVRFESAQSLSLNRGRSLSPEAEIALEDVSRIRDEVQRGRERLFHASLSVTLHANDQDGLKDLTQKARAHFAATLGKLDNLAFRQTGGPAIHPAPGPERRGGVADPGHVITGQAVPFLAAGPGHPQRHPLRHRPASLRPHRLRPLRRHPPERQHCGPGKVRAAARVLPPSWACCGGVCRGVRAYVIDPEGEYADMARAAGGRVLSPGIARPGHEPLCHRPGRQRRAVAAHRQPADA